MLVFHGGIQGRNQRNNMVVTAESDYKLCGFRTSDCLFSLLAILYSPFHTQVCASERFCLLIFCFLNFAIYLIPFSPPARF